MMMRFLKLSMAFGCLAGFSVPATAYETFIPTGTGYSTEVDSLPALDGELGQAISQADVYETELNRKAKEDAEFDSKMRRFFIDSSTPGGDTFIDY
jgi:hypothetical protein